MQISVNNTVKEVFDCKGSVLHVQNITQQHTRSHAFFLVHDYLWTQLEVIFCFYIVAASYCTAHIRLVSQLFPSGFPSSCIPEKVVQNFNNLMYFVQLYKLIPPS